MEQESAVEIADRMARRRARVLPLSAILFLGWQANYALSSDHPARTVDHVKIAAWLVWALALLFILASGGGLLRGRKVRSLLNDESTREHRRIAYSYGFWAAMGCAVTLYGVEMFEPVPGREAVHLILTAGVAAAVLTFSILERRSFRDA